MLRLAAVVRGNCYAFVIQEGMKALDVMPKQDREALWGPPHEKSKADAPVRWGHAEGRLVMGGQQVVVNKPRLRHQSKELVSHLQHDHPDPAASLREGLDETLTLKDMSLSESLERTSPPLR